MTMTLSEAYVDFIAGWTSGAITILAIQPVDTVLTRVQAGEALVAGSAATNMSTQSRALMSSYGWASLWRGSSAMISAVPFQNAFLMGGYGLGKQWSESSQYSQTETLFSVFVGGCTGGVLQSFIMSPVELIKVQQQVKATKMTATTLLSSSSVFSSSFWRGLNATLLRDGIPHGVWFASYEWTKQELSRRAALSNLDESSMTETVAIPMTSGALAATVAWAVGYPFDIIKTRIQASIRPNQPPLGIYQTGSTLVTEYGLIAGLYRGFGLKLVRAVPASMLGFVTYEAVANYIRG